MDSSSEGSLEPSAATALIGRAGRVVTSSRRWHVGSMVVLGCATLAYFALLAVFAHKSGKGLGLPGVILFVLPLVVVYALLGIRRMHPSVGGRDLQAVERRFGNVYMLALLPAGVLAELVPHPVPAVFMGVIAAVPCFLGAWRAAHL
jgi:hypothetical protein